MQNRFNISVFAFLGASLVQIALAQAPPPAPPAPPGPGSSAVANPTYVTIPLEITINKPAAEVWARVGKYCDIGEWLQVQCRIVSGNGEVGTVRSIGTAQSKPSP
jgi:hypothetical protein